MPVTFFFSVILAHFKNLDTATKNIVKGWQKRSLTKKEGVEVSNASSSSFQEHKLKKKRKENEKGTAGTAVIRVLWLFVHSFRLDYDNYFGLRRLRKGLPASIFLTGGLQFGSLAAHNKNIWKESLKVKDVLKKRVKDVFVASNFFTSSSSPVDYFQKTPKLSFFDSLEVTFYLSMFLQKHCGAGAYIFYFFFQCLPQAVVVTQYRCTAVIFQLIFFFLLFFLMLLMWKLSSQKNMHSCVFLALHNFLRWNQ